MLRIILQLVKYQKLARKYSKFHVLKKLLISD